MLEKTLENIAERILALDEASLTGLWKKYKLKMEEFNTTKEWEKAVIVFFIINAVRVKNHIFNEQVAKNQEKHSDKNPDNKKKSKDIPYLKRIK
ncbi:MAG: hypothetical protein JW743_01875 [Deltaproteobacteria bacterium]|jgi:hypothetical protein|nr:hypothetical protein [Deltaproteobacteria bacterium]MBN2845928.1 hypothetical protein [Deltaproteobacteria bacterium]